MFVNSGITDAYIGSSGITKIYLGDVLIWPLSAGTLIETYDNLEDGDLFVLIEPISKKIVGNNGSQNINFSDFNGDGLYSGLPNGTSVFRYEKGSPVTFENGVCANSYDCTEYSQYNVRGKMYYGCGAGTRASYKSGSYLRSTSMTYGTTVNLFYDTDYGYPVFLSDHITYKNRYKIYKIRRIG